jgi:hypothetical protein
MTALTSTQKSTLRKAALQARAEQYGFASWSSMLTAIKNGMAKVVKVHAEI